MTRTTITEYKAANGGDYDKYTLSDGRVYWLWLKVPFKGSVTALVHIVEGMDKEIGTVHMEHSGYGTLRMGLDDHIGKNIRRVEVDITLNQELRPNKKYYFDKIVRHLLM